MNATIKTQDQARAISEALTKAKAGDKFVKVFVPNSHYDLTKGMSVLTLVTVKEINMKLRTPRVIMTNGDRFTLDGLSVGDTHGRLRLLEKGETPLTIQTHNQKRQTIIDKHEADLKAAAQKDRAEAITANATNLHAIRSLDTAVGNLLLMDAVNRRGDAYALSIRVETFEESDYSVKIDKGYATYTKFSVGYTGWQFEKMNSGRTYWMTTTNSNAGEGRSLTEALEDMVARLW